MVTNMNDVIDAWSEHIYRNYSDHLRMEERLKDVAHLVGHEFPASAQKPTLLLEYGRPRDEQLRDQADRDGGVLVTRGRRGALWQAGLSRRVAPP